MECSSSEDDEDVLSQDIRACCGCLKTECLLYAFRKKQLKRAFSEITGLPVSVTDQLFCAVCLHLLRKFSLFRAQCLQAARKLQQISSQNDLLYTSLKTKHFNLVKAATKVISLNPCKSISSDDSIKLNDNHLENDIFDLDLEPKKETFAHNIGNNSNCATSHIGFHDRNHETNLIKEVFHFTSSDNEVKSNHSTDNDDEDNYFISDIIKKEKSKAINDNTKKRSKLKPVKHKNDINNRNYKIKNIKVNKNVPEDKQLVKELAERFKNVWRWNGKTKNKLDIYGVFQRIYEESIAANDGKSFKDDTINMDKAMECMQQELRIFLDLTKKLSEVYNMDVDFLSIEQQKREIEEKKQSAEYRDARYKCGICCKTFNFPDTCERHSLAHKQHPGDEMCAICLYRFKRRTQFTAHLHTMHQKKLKCRECGAVFRTWLLAKEHHQSHRGISQVCKLCNKRFNEKKLYYMHIRKVHKEEIATARCSLCRDSFNGMQGLRMHMDRAHKLAVQCSSCECWFHNPDTLDAHHTACQPGYSCCGVCGAGFPTEALMNSHYEQQHKQDYTCDQCNKPFKSVHSYKWHVTQRHGNAAVRKVRSGKPTKRVRDDKWKKNFVCDVCGKNDFPFLSCLKQHQRKHKGDKAFPCGECRKQFTELGALKVHALTHTGEKRHQCPYCPKTFRQKGNRDAHVLTHTKEKAHSCPVCQRKFALRSNMIKHIKTVHSGHPLPPTKRRSKERNDELN